MAYISPYYIEVAKENSLYPLLINLQDKTDLSYFVKRSEGQVVRDLFLLSELYHTLDKLHTGCKLVNIHKDDYTSRHFIDMLFTCYNWFSENIEVTRERLEKIRKILSYYGRYFDSTGIVQARFNFLTSCKFDSKFINNMSLAECKERLRVARKKKDWASEEEILKDLKRIKELLKVAFRRIVTFYKLENKEIESEKKKKPVKKRDEFRMGLSKIFF